MKVDDIRSLRRASPFRPFYLVLADGRKLPVDRPMHLAIAPAGEMLVHATLDGWFEKVSSASVSAVDFNIDVEEVQNLRRAATLGDQ